MYISTIWLKKLINLSNYNLKNIKNKLTICGFEIEEEKIYNNLGKNDVILNLKTTTNRPDLLSFVGLVEEFNIILKTKIKKTKIKKKKIDFFKHYTAENIEQNCEKNFPSTIAFLLTKFENININEIQPWIKERLLASNITPQNNLNDLKQYLILEWGQPIFFYDYDKLKLLTRNNNPKISTRFAYENEIFVDCFLKKHFLTTDNLIVVADNIPISIAGNLVSNNCCIESKTKNLLIETSIYEPKVFRISERSLGLRTESSILFERGINKFLIKAAFNRFFKIFNLINQGSITKITYYCNFFAATKFIEKKVNISIENIKKIIFFNLNQKNQNVNEIVINSLNQMRFKFIKKKENFFIVFIPFTRYFDIEEEIDLIEEITRVIGFNNFVSTLPKINKIGNISKYELFKRKLRNFLINLGFLELFNFSLTYENNQINNIVILNSLIKEYSLLRKSLIYQILQVVEKNNKQGNKLISVFEIGRIFNKIEENILKEDEILCGFFYGSNYKISWSEKNFQLNWFQVKGFLETIFKNLELEYYFSINNEISEYYHPKNTISIHINKKKVGSFGKINPKISSKLNLPKNCFLFELEITKIYKAQKIEKNVTYKQFSIFPYLVIDMSLLIPKKINFEIIEKTIRQCGGNLLQTIELFDFYENLESKDEFYSLGIKLSFRSLNKTLLKNEIDFILLKIEEKLKNNLNIQFRN